jgi:hypothetical protein
MKGSYVGFLVFVFLLITFFVIPDPEGLQKPFRIAIALLFVFIYVAQLIKREIPLKSLIPVLGAGALLLIMINRGTLQTSFFNAALCLVGVVCLPSLTFKLDGTYEIRRTNLIYIHTICLISILVQFLIFSSKDGRPTLAYEINLSGAYLFLFFLLSDVIKLRHGKIAVIILSLLTLSRLLVLSILLFYLVRHLKPFFRKGLEKINIKIIVASSYILISIFSLWYVANVKRQISYDKSIKRLTTLNDGSNELRFLANTLVLASIYKAPFEGKTLFGYGKIENFLKATKDSLIMPHNELFDSIVQFGIISVVFFAFFSLPVYKQVTNFNNLEFFFPVLLYTLILWVRFLLVPSFEMIFILFLLYIRNGEGALEPEIA